MINKEKCYVVVDIETTGLSAYSDRIIEIGAVKIENGEITGEFCELIDPGIPIPYRITSITGITTDMVAGKSAIEEVLPLFLEFCGGSAIVAHNARFDMGFIKHNADKLGCECNHEVVDTLYIARRLFPQLKSHKLDAVADHLGIEQEDYHRALSDAKTAAHIFLRCSEH